MKSRKMASALLSGVLCFSLFVTPAFACSDDTSGIEKESISLYSVQNETYTKDELLQMAEIFSGWENDELNEYIDYLASNSSTQTRASFVPNDIILKVILLLLGALLLLIGAVVFIRIRKKIANNIWIPLSLICFLAGIGMIWITICTMALFAVGE